MRECWSRIIVIGYLTENLKAETYSAIHYLRKALVFKLWCPSRIVSAHLYVGNCVMPNGTRHQNYRILYRNLSVGINGYKLLILRKIMFLIYIRREEIQNMRFFFLSVY